VSIVGDQAGYRAFVREIRGRAGQTHLPFVAFVLARTCIQVADPPVESGQVTRWAEQAVEGSQVPWYLHALGAAHYRAGQFDKAIKTLEESNRTYSSRGMSDEYKIQNILVLAMAHQRSGNPKEARALLRQAQSSLERALAAKTDGAVPLHSTDWLPIQILRREAESIVLYDPIFPANPLAR
jgi:tetratricopeptide (TPR) repeat protein